MIHWAREVSNLEFIYYLYIYIYIYRAGGSIQLGGPFLRLLMVGQL